MSEGDLSLLCLAISKCAKPVQSSSLAEPGLPNDNQGDDNDDDDDDEHLLSSGRPGWVSQSQ